jgi:hypothetical protein
MVEAEDNRISFYIVCHYIFECVYSIEENTGEARLEDWRASGISENYVPKQLCPSAVSKEVS